VETVIFVEMAGETCSDKGKEIFCPCHKERASGHNEEGGFDSGEVDIDLAIVMDFVASCSDQAIGKESVVGGNDLVTWVESVCGDSSGQVI
jgi:hypothetical protein